MLLLEQLELRFEPLRLHVGRDRELEQRCANLLRAAGAKRIADRVQVRWSARLKSTAGRADHRALVITLNPRLEAYGQPEIDRTLRHELAHLLAQSRVGRRRIPPHGAEWRAACADLGIDREARCHLLPFPIARRKPRYLYRCPHCRRDFPRVRKARRPIACLACCRQLNRGQFDERAKLQLVRS